MNERLASRKAGTARGSAPEGTGNGVITPHRLEVKVALEPRHLADIEAWVRVHPAHWRVAYPSRQVNNIYFDTLTYMGLNDNLSGVADRAKVRLRWYGKDVTRVANGILEVKRKAGHAGWKELHAVSADLDLASSWRDLTRALRLGISGAACCWLDRCPMPVLINHYRRSYYETPDGVLRLTIDADLQAYDQRSLTHPNLLRAAHLDPYVVIELKASVDPGAARRLADALAHFPVGADRFSKYVQGVLAAPDLG
ncbi:MAG: VTC domain-containing protein [Anaerolineae bacterium]